MPSVSIYAAAVLTGNNLALPSLLERLLHPGELPQTPAA